MEILATVAIILFNLTIWALAVLYTVRNKPKKALIVFFIAVTVSILGVFISRFVDFSPLSVSHIEEEHIHDHE